MSIEKTIDRARHEWKQGRAWRAKEILASSLPQFNYPRNGCLELGNVLLSMNDDLMAGMYFLLSVEEPNDQQLAAMNIFLNRYAADSIELFITRFPRNSLPRELANVPRFLEQQLRQRGAPDRLTEQASVGSVSSGVSYPVKLAIVSGLLFLLFCTVLGLLQVAQFLIQWES